MRTRNPGYKFRSAHNIWVIGKIMWELLTLKTDVDLNKEIYLMTEELYYGEMQEEAIREIQTNRKPDFSSDLRQLIRECLRIDPNRRPSPRDLYEVTKRQLRDRANEVRDDDTGLKKGRRVFYMGNEINDMPVGSPADISYPYVLFEQARDQRFIDPELSSLRKGRWEPPMPGSPEERPIVKGGRKKRPLREAYGFMPHRNDPNKLIKVAVPASEIEDLLPQHKNDDEDGDTVHFDEDSDHDSNGSSDDEVPHRGWPKGRGKTKPGEEERAAARDGQGVAGEALAGSGDDGEDNGHDRSDRTDSGSTSRKRKDHEGEEVSREPSTISAKRPRKSGSWERADGDVKESVRQGGSNNGASHPADSNEPHEQGAFDPVAIAGKVLAALGKHGGPGRSITPSTPSRSPTRPGNFGKHLPGQGLQDNVVDQQQQPSPLGTTPQGSHDRGGAGGTSSSSDAIRPAGRREDGNRGRGGARRGTDTRAPTRGRGRRKGKGRKGEGKIGPQKPPKPQQQQQQSSPSPRRPSRRARRQDQAIIEQVLPALQVENVGGRALRQRKK